jgi:hypothetical protein
MRILDLLDQASAARLRPQSPDDVLEDRRRPAAPPSSDPEPDARAPLDPRVAAAFAELDPTTRQKFVELFLGLAKDHRDVESARHRKAGTTQRSKRR